MSVAVPKSSKDVKTSVSKSQDLRVEVERVAEVPDEAVKRAVLSHFSKRPLIAGEEAKSNAAVTLAKTSLAASS